MAMVHWAQPSHPDTVRVINKLGDFASYSVSQGDFKPGMLLASLKAPMLAFSTVAYSSVQVGSSSSHHIELNCDFLFINHSCEPNLEFHVLNSASLPKVIRGEVTDHDIVIEIRVASRVDSEGKEIGLREGEALSFFYPSTEWDMAQPFKCLCKAKGCKGLIRGAKYLDRTELQDYFINKHIWVLKEEQERSGGAESSENVSSSVRTDASFAS